MNIGSVHRCGGHQALADKLFATADTNGDGTLSMDEFTAMMAKLPQPGDTPASATSGSATPAAAPESAGMMPATQTPQDAFAAFDADGDGSVSAAELDNGLDNVAKKLRKAIAAFHGGDDTSLVDLIFRKDALLDAAQGNTDSNNATAGDKKSMASDLSSVDVSPTDTASLDASSDLTSSSDASTSDSSAYVQAQRQLQWMLNAFASQFNVSQQPLLAA